jgi:oligopeptidase A
MMSDRNPLLRVEFRIPFDCIRAEHVEPAVKQLLTEACTRVENLADSRDSDSRQVHAALEALDALTEPLDRTMGVVRHLESVATSPELRAAYNAVQPEVSAFYSSIPLHEGLWRTIKNCAASAEAARLNGTRKRYLAKTVDTFRRHGADLDPAGKARLEVLDVELTMLTIKFSQNVLDSTNAFELMIADPAKLAGLPPSAVEGARQSAAERNMEGWRFTLQAPSYIALMTYLDDRGIREQVYHAYNVRAAGGDWDNRPLIRDILALRREKARLLGFRDFADFALDDRMAKNGARAREFLESLRARSEAAFRRENEELQAFGRRLEGPDAPELEPWDIAYYAEKMRQALYDFDEEALRPYFPLERVGEGMFEIASRLYGVQVTEESAAPVWDPHVKYYQVRDADGTFLGGLYADWYPRENKRGGAWMDALMTGGPAPDGFEPHLGLICGNLTPPVGDKPSLLTHREVQTIFHEFGHLLHHILSRVEVRSLAGTNVAWDFVELPSQIMENWSWERQALDLFARHYATGAAIPEDLFAKMQRAKNFRSANAMMRQLGFGILDLALHTDYEEERDGDVMEYARRMIESFSPAKLPPDHAMIAAFTHLFASPVGYGAGYYSYKWAEVLDADAFTQFRDHGIFSREIGSAFRDKILSKGDSEDPADLYRTFMGRDPDPNALLERSGLMV